MLHGLSLIQPPKVPPTVTESLEQLLEASIEHVTPRRLPMDDPSETITEFQVLRDTIKTEGLSKSLLAFINQNNRLSDAIPEIPALESFTADLSVENSQEIVAALEGIILEMSKEKPKD